MTSTTHLYSSVRSFDPFSKTRTVKSGRTNSRKITSFGPFSKPRDIKPGRARIYAARREARNGKFGGRAVDENLIVLRKRIHEMKMVESGYSELPSEWMDWEKRVYSSYDSVICDAMGHLQLYLMETRPSLAIGVFVLVALSVPTSAIVVLYHLVEISRGLIHQS